MELATWPTYARRLPHVLAAAEHAEDLHVEQAEAARLLNQFGYYLSERGQLTEAMSSYARALGTWEQVLGPSHPITAISLNNLGGLLQAQGDLVAARLYFERPLPIREQVLGPDHPDTATSLNNLGGLCGPRVTWPPLARISSAP
jgi:Tfp pilus assembly protein PilF